VGIVSNYVFIVPAVITVGWVLSWWRSWLVRWALLFTAATISVLCVVGSSLGPAPQVTPPGHCLAGQIQCMPPPQGPIDWFAAGLVGFAWCVVLLVVTLVVEIIILIRSWASAQSEE
jgi:hypothetical protein